MNMCLANTYMYWARYAQPDTIILYRRPKPDFIYKAKWHHTNHEYIDSIISQIMKGSVHHKSPPKVKKSLPN
jgi:hypothetical protein